MGQLTGISKRTTVQYIEVVADDSSAVLMISTHGDRVTLQTRLPHEDRWSHAKTPEFTIQSGDKSLLASIINGADVSWQRTKLDEISGAAFSLPNPNPEPDEDEQRRCAELDIERAKAANLAEEKALLQTRMSVDHINNKHGNYEIAACELCEMRIRPGRGDGSLPAPEDVPSEDDTIYTSREDEYEQETGNRIDPLPY